MELKYGVELDSSVVLSNIERLINQTYKLLPSREEGLDWETPLQTIIEEIAGLNRLLIGRKDVFLTLLSKMEGLFTLTSAESYPQFRRLIFDCLGLMTSLKKYVRFN